MIVILAPGLSVAEVDRIRELIDRRGSTTVASVGAGHSILRLLDTDGPAATAPFLTSIPGVHRVVHTSSPYPLVSQDMVMRRLTVEVGKAKVGADRFTLIAGPCAVETDAQARVAWAAAVTAGASVLRGDLFKHRTSPYSFQGLGAYGLDLLRDERRRTGLPMVLEVLSARDIEVVAEVADVLRIGARNMQNVDLLHECGRSGRPVILKRGFSSTIDEWLLAAETVASTGNLDIILCERGIRTFETATRNTLDLSAVLVAQQRSHLPVIVDPAHASGSRSLVAPLALAAVAAGADGVMLDVHPRPDSARCDGAQALLPEDLVDLGGRLRNLAEWMGRRLDIAAPWPAAPTVVADGVAAATA